jgi:hypothetical protein
MHIVNGFDPGTFLACATLCIASQCIVETLVMYSDMCEGAGVEGP